MVWVWVNSECLENSLAAYKQAYYGVIRSPLATNIYIYIYIYVATDSALIPNRSDRLFRGRWAALGLNAVESELLDEKKSGIAKKAVVGEIIQCIKERKVCSLYIYAHNNKNMTSLQFFQSLINLRNATTKTNQKKAN